MRDGWISEVIKEELCKMAKCYRQLKGSIADLWKANSAPVSIWVIPWKEETIQAKVLEFTNSEYFYWAETRAEKGKDQGCPSQHGVKGNKRAGLYKQATGLYGLSPVPYHHFLSCLMCGYTLIYKQEQKDLEEKYSEA